MDARNSGGSGFASGVGSDNNALLVLRHSPASVQRRPVAGLRNYDAELVSDALALDTGEATIVQQHLAQDADVNVIMKRFGATGQMPAGVPGGVFGDFTGVEDYRSAVEAIERANAGFMSLPADVREQFDNDPGRLIEYARTASNDEILALGVRPAEPAAPPVAPVVAAAPIAAAPAPAPGGPAPV